MRGAVWIYIFPCGQYFWSGISYPLMDQKEVVYCGHAYLGPSGGLQPYIPWGALSWRCAVWGNLGRGMWHIALPYFQVGSLNLASTMVDC